MTAVGAKLSFVRTSKSSCARPRRAPSNSSRGCSPSGSFRTRRARSIFMLGEGDEDVFAESQFKSGDRFPVALGTTDPLLGLPALSERRRVA